MVRLERAWVRRWLAACAVAVGLPAALSGQAADTPAGGSYRSLRPEQTALIGRWTREVGDIVGKAPDPEQAYDQLPLSSRTTF
jgi:hypothetical protein